MNDTKEYVQVDKRYLRALESIVNEYKSAIEDLGWKFEISNHPDPLKRKWNRVNVRGMLQEWYYIDHNINDLDDRHLREAKSFYYRLTYLTDDERAKLAYIHYYEDKQNFPTNDEIKAKYNLDSYRVSEFRNKLIDKLSIPRLAPKDDKGTD